VAITREEARDEYLKRVYKIFLECEKFIDTALVNNFNKLKESGTLNISEKRIMGYSTDFEFQDRYRKQLVSLILEKYSDWKVVYDNGMATFSFHYKEEKEENLISLLTNLEERFKGMDIDEDDDEEDDEEILDDSFFDEGYSNEDVPF